MHAIYAALVCVAGALICAVVRPQRPEVSVGVVLATGCLAVMICLPELQYAVSGLLKLNELAGEGQEQIRLLLRACGISLIAEFASQVCADAGETALAGRVRIGLRFVLLAMALPLLTDLVRDALSMLD